MRNNHPKSEGPAMKEHAALDKEMLARQKTTEAEKAAHTGHAEAVASDRGRERTRAVTTNLFVQDTAGIADMAQRIR
jgi:hypothetical protein